MKIVYYYHICDALNEELLTRLLRSVVRRFWPTLYRSILLIAVISLHSHVVVETFGQIWSSLEKCSNFWYGNRRNLWRLIEA